MFSLLTGLRSRIAWSLPRCLDSFRYTVLLTKYCTWVISKLGYNDLQNRNFILIESSSTVIVALSEMLHILRNTVFLVCSFYPLGKLPSSSPWVLPSTYTSWYLAWFFTAYHCILCQLSRGNSSNSWSRLDEFMLVVSNANSGTPTTDSFNSFWFYSNSGWWCSFGMKASNFLLLGEM